MAEIELQGSFWINEYISPWDIYAHGVQKVIAYQKTQFQEMYVVETGVYGKALILDGKWQCCTGDEFLYHEPLVQPAMISHGDPKKVLILGGGDGGAAREVLRWHSIEEVVTVDLDAMVVEACRAHLPEIHQGSFDHPRSRLVIGDALAYVTACEQQGETWDVILGDLPDPLDGGPCFELFTQEFYQQVANILKPQGYFALQAGPVAPPTVAVHGRLVNTLKQAFPHVVSYACHVPTFGESWAMAIAGHTPINQRPDPQVVDQLLQQQTTNDLRLVDGQTLLGMLQTPKYIRQAIDENTKTYTKQEHPEYFGTGINS
jgi:spermidine synthase